MSNTHKHWCGVETYRSPFISRNSWVSYITLRSLQCEQTSKCWADLILRLTYCPTAPCCPMVPGSPGCPTGRGIGPVKSLRGPLPPWPRSWYTSWFGFTQCPILCYDCWNYEPVSTGLPQEAQLDLEDQLLLTHHWFPIGSSVCLLCTRKQN